MILYGLPLLPLYLVTKFRRSNAMGLLILYFMDAKMKLRAIEV